MVAVACWAACSRSQATVPEASAPTSHAQVPAETVSSAAVTLADHQGRTLHLASPARRIVSLSPALTEILFAVGCGDAVVLRDGWSDYPPEARRIPAAHGFVPNAEAILSTHPDLVLTHFPPTALRTALDAAKVPYLSYSPKDLRQVQETLGDVARACGHPEAGRVLQLEFAGRLKDIQTRVAGLPKPRVFYEMDAGDGARPFTVSREAFGHAVLEAAGGQNLFADAVLPWFQVSTEAVLTADPDAILLADADAIEAPQSLASVQARPGWQALRAVREGHVHPLRSDWVSRPGPRLVLGVEQIARALHPDAFPPLEAK
jgi:iron complex transport system substrate-binding protein